MKVMKIKEALKEVNRLASLDGAKDYYARIRVYKQADSEKNIFYSVEIELNLYDIDDNNLRDEYLTLNTYKSEEKALKRAKKIAKKTGYDADNYYEHMVIDIT